MNFITLEMGSLEKSNVNSGFGLGLIARKLIMACLLLQTFVLFLPATDMESIVIIVLNKPSKHNSYNAGFFQKD